MKTLPVQPYRRNTKKCFDHILRYSLIHHLFRNTQTKQTIHGKQESVYYIVGMCECVYRRMLLQKQLLRPAAHRAQP